MTAQDLKNSILQLAVEGKLLSRKEVAEALETTEGPKTGAELLEQIKAEKAKLIAEGKIKKATTKAGASGRALAEITEDEKPFDIPENWCWCRLGEIADIKSSKRVFEKDYVLKGIPFYRSKEIVDLENGDELRTPLYISEEHFEALKKNYGVPQPNDILIASIGATIGKSWIVDKRDFYYKDGNITQICSSDYFDSKYVYYFVKGSLFYMQVMGDVAGTAYNALTIIKLKNLLFPLPPLAEQKRIVAKIEELLPYIQKYDVAHTKLEEFNKKFPVEMQKSILQQAIMGKLTEDWRNEQASLAKTNSTVQLDDRSSAKDLLKKIKAQKARLIAEGKIKKDKPLAEITEDEIPFDIPESWCWCRLGDICFDIKRGKSPKYVEKSNYLAFAQKCNVKTGGINLEIALYLDESTISRYSNTDCLVQGDVVINSTGGGTMGRVGYFECEIPKGIKGIYPDSHVTTIRTVGFMEQKFVFYFLKTKQKELESLGEGSTNQTELKPYTLQNLLLPLPPLAEQKAIVAKIEELLPLCKKLVK